MRTPLVNPGDLLTAHAGSDAVAVHDLTLGRARDVTYRALAAEVDAAARGLVERGLAPGARVALVSGNRLEFLAAFFGIMKAGMVPLPISIRLPPDALASLVGAARPDLVLADGPRAALLPGAPQAPVLSLDDPQGYAALRRPGPFAAVARPPDAIAMQPYTSGTTGLPKGIRLTQRAALWALAKMLPPDRPANPDTVVTVAHPLYHKNAMLGTKGAFLNGGRIVMMERFDPAAFAAAIGRFGVTKVHTVPTMMARILADPALVARIDQRSIREVHMGSAPVSQRLFDDVRAAFPRATVRISYGVTEAGPMQFGEHPAGRPRPPRSVGFPLPDVELRLVGGATPDEGVLHIRNPGVMVGYDDAPEETARRFTPDGWYVTGDVLRRDADGFYFFVGRDDDMFVVGGYNLYPAAVEATLLRHPDVLQAAVVAVDDAIKGQVPHAFVVLRAGAAADEATLKDFALRHAPAHEHPRRVHVVAELPWAGTNKVDTRLLRATAARLAREQPA
jgi:acyl-CoA synthetase (AMP-forming)/AMP-acid ligase II